MSSSTSAILLQVGVVVLVVAVGVVLMYLFVTRGMPRRAASALPAALPVAAPSSPAHTASLPVPPSTTATPFPLSAFRQACGDTLLRTEYFRDTDGRRLLDPTHATTVSLAEWLDNTAAYGGYAAKLKFRRDTTHPIGQFLLRWLETELPRLPAALRERYYTFGEEVECCLRITNGDWHYPAHYDCVDNYALVLRGQRYCRLDEATILHLTAGQYLYIPMGQTHEFWCGGDHHELNLLFNVDFVPAGPATVRECQRAFAATHPVQQQRLAAMVEYT